MDTQGTVQDVIDKWAPLGISFPLGLMEIVIVIAIVVHARSVADAQTTSREWSLQQQGMLFALNSGIGVFASPVIFVLAANGHVPVWTLAVALLTLVLLSFGIVKLSSLLRRAQILGSLMALPQPRAMSDRFTTLSMILTAPLGAFSILLPGWSPWFPDLWPYDAFAAAAAATWLACRLSRRAMARDRVA